MPGLRRLPAAKVLALAEIALLAREHVTRLDPQERRRFLALVRRARGRTSKLSARERAELTALVAKVNPRLFVGLVADKLSPVPLPRRVVRGRR
jgi:energy-coupling factor transporter ATP-binding protein EcfA2